MLLYHMYSGWFVGGCIFIQEMQSLRLDDRHHPPKLRTQLKDSYNYPAAASP